MQILHRPKYNWEKVFSFEERKQMVEYYLQGYAVNRIREAFNTTQTTVEHHLNAANVYIKFRKATIKQPIIRQEVIVTRTIIFPLRKVLRVTMLDNDSSATENGRYYFNELGEKCVRPLQYKDYLIEANRKAILRSNDLIENKGAGDNFVPLIKIKISDPTESSFQASQSVLSW